MSMDPRHDVENIPADLDRFLGNFFSRRGWRSALKYDPAADLLYLEVHLADTRLAGDDRFFSLVEYYARAQNAVVRQRAGLPLQCRLYAADGAELTATLHRRGSSYLDDNERGSGMRRRLLWLSFRRRFVARVLPGALLWAAALILVIGVLGVDPVVAVAVSLAALAVQGAVIFFTGPGHR